MSNLLQRVQEQRESVAAAASSAAQEVPLAQLMEAEVRTGSVELPVLPEVAVKVRDIIARDGHSSEISAVIEREPAFAASVLRYANSVAFAGLKEITDLRQAVTRLGTNAVEQMILAISARGAFQGGDPADENVLRRLWNHSISTALAARRLAARTQGVGPEQAFLGGLLHDIGKVVILRSVASLRRRDPVRYGFPEPALLEFFDSLHCSIGEALFDSWRLPKEIRDVVRRHHDERLDPVKDHLVLMVSFADRITAKLGSSLRPDPTLSLLEHPAAAPLRLDDVKLAALLIDIEDDVQAFQESF